MHMAGQLSWLYYISICVAVSMIGSVVPEGGGLCMVSRSPHSVNVDAMKSGHHYDL